MTADSTVIGAVAALAGSVVGAFSALGTTFVSQRLQVRGAHVAAELNERKELYGRFIDEAVSLFMESVEQKAIDPAKIMRLYSIVARIRLLSGGSVLRAAETVVKQVIASYESERGSRDTRQVMLQYSKSEDTLDPLREFTEACRHERAKVLQQL